MVEVMDLLHDGVAPVTSIALFLYVRNNAKYLREYLLPKLSKLENLYSNNAVFTYYIYENDSTDDTQQLVSEFMATGPRPGVFLTEELNLSKTMEGTSFERIGRMAFVRNRLLDRARAEPCFANHNWCLFIDSDIFFDEGSLAEMFAIQPAKNDIVMITCNTQEVFRNTFAQDVIPGCVPIVTQYHYYDTFALVSMDDKLSYPMCCNPTCARLECEDAPKRHVTLNVGCVTEVRSAWAGFVLIDASALCNPGVRWKALKIFDGNSLCEHIYFCDVLRATSQKKVVILEPVHCYWMKRG